MNIALIKSKYKWQYVIVAVLLALIICSFFIWWKYGRDNNNDHKVDKHVSLTSTTTGITGKPDVIGKETSRKTTTKESATTTGKWKVPTASQTPASTQNGTTDPKKDDDSNNNNPPTNIKPPDKDSGKDIRPPNDKTDPPPQLPTDPQPPAELQGTP